MPIYTVVQGGTITTKHTGGDETYTATQDCFFVMTAITNNAGSCYIKDNYTGITYTAAGTTLLVKNGNSVTVHASPGTIDYAVYAINIFKL